MMVFDKTGTLTEDGLQVFGFRGVEQAIVRKQTRHIFGEFTNDCKKYQPTDQWWLDSNPKGEREQLAKDPKTIFLESIASCHSITYVNGELIGDPLDVKMFQATGWILDEPHDGDPGNDELVLCYIRPPN